LTAPARALLALAALLLFVIPALAVEQIHAFTSDVTLATDGTVDVVETIDINADYGEVTHGIYRDLPLELRNPDGSTLRSSLNVISVERDGAMEPYSIEGLGGAFKRIRIGDADVYLDRTLHHYVIHYTMTRMGRNFADHDELFWNATGNYWDFPILKATATLTLPPGAEISGQVAYVGVPGSTEQSSTLSQEGRTVTARTTRVLQVGEGLSVAVKFQKGILATPGSTQATLDWLSDHRETWAPLLAALLALGYYFSTWMRVGRDPARGTIIPLFHPPKDFSPALVQYVDRMGWDQAGWSAFTASIFDLGVKGLVSIDRSSKSLKVSVTDKAPGTLPPGEEMLYAYLKTKGTLTINKTTGAEVNGKRGEFLAALERENRAAYFNNNTAYVVVGVLLSIALIGIMVLFDVLEPGWLVAALFGGVVLGMLSTFLRRTWGRGGGFGRAFMLIWFVVVGVNVVGGLGHAFTDLSLGTGAWAAASIALVNVVFAVLMRAPTMQGRKIMDQIDGFKMYLDTAEKERLNLVGEPPMTVSRFEAILPFAIALGIEKPWSHYFESELARNAVADVPSGGYSPLWYSGSDFSSPSQGFSSAMSSATAGMSAAMIAAQPASSSSSGFSGGGGGGGGSGGGGGGGGGGGW
jgi:uncharacterized membrane protein YgcG